MSSRRCHIVFFDDGLKSEDGFLLPDGSIVASPPEEDIVFDKARLSTIQPCGLPGINHFRKLSFHEKQEECNYHQSKSVFTTRKKKKNKKREDTKGSKKGDIAPVFDKARLSTIQPCGLPGINHFRKLSFHEKQEECNYHQSKSVLTTRKKKKNKKREDTKGSEKGDIDPVIPRPIFIGYRLPPPELTKFVDTSSFPILALSQEMLDRWSDGDSDLE